MRRITEPITIRTRSTHQGQAPRPLRLRRSPPATDGQRAAIEELARQQDCDLEKLLGTYFGVASIEALSVDEALELLNEWPSLAAATRQGP
jgi:hypothetical protein